MGHRPVGVGATYAYYDHHMERTRLRLVAGEFGESPPPRNALSTYRECREARFLRAGRLGLRFL